MKKTLLLTLFFVITAFLLASNYWVGSYSDYTTANIEKLPDSYACLVLGTSKKLRNGRDNQFFSNRIDATLTVYQAKKCKKIIVSGDNRYSDYNEPNDMKQSLIEKGIPPADIICDYAGRRTIDSVIRYKEIFGQEAGIVISQQFHNERAVFIGQKNNIHLFGYNANDVDAYNSFKTKFREIFSKGKVIYDVYLLNSTPKILGEKIKI